MFTCSSCRKLPSGLVLENIECLCMEKCLENKVYIHLVMVVILGVLVFVVVIVVMGVVVAVSLSLSLCLPLLMTTMMYPRSSFLFSLVFSPVDHYRRHLSFLFSVSAVSGRHNALIEKNGAFKRPQKLSQVLRSEMLKLSPRFPGIVCHIVCSRFAYHFFHAHYIRISPLCS